MIKRAVFLWAALAVAPAWAVNKCKAPDGKIVYQDGPCATTDQSHEVKLPQTNGTTQSSTASQLRFKLTPITPDDAKAKATADMAIAKASLKDPDSAKFNDVKVFSFEALGKSFVMTCGELNAKNSYGGYVGSKRFWVYDGVFTETWNHYLSGSKMQWLMGDVQNACFKQGTAI